LLIINVMDVIMIITRSLMWLGGWPQSLLRVLRWSSHYIIALIICLRVFVGGTTGIILNFDF